MLIAHPELYNVGYGFWISPVKFGAVTARAADRQGSISGNKSTWIHLIDQKKTVIIFSNSDATNINEMREKFVLSSLNQPLNLPVDAENRANPKRFKKFQPISGNVGNRFAPDSQCRALFEGFRHFKRCGQKFFGRFLRFGI